MGICRLAPVTGCCVWLNTFLTRLQTKPHLNWSFITALVYLFVWQYRMGHLCSLFRCNRQLVSELTCFSTGERAEDLAAHIIISHYCGDMEWIEDNMLSGRTRLTPLLVQNGINQVNNFALWTQFPNTWRCSLEWGPFTKAISLCQVAVCFTIWMYVQEIFKDRQVHHELCRQELTHPPSASCCESKASRLSGVEAACAGIVQLHLSDNPC